MNAQQKKLKDLLIPLSNYPHMPYWGTLREAIAQLNLAYERGHHTVLVFDEDYKLVGMLSEKNILTGLVPKFARHYSDGVPVYWDDLLESGSKKRLDEPIKKFMVQVQVVGEPEDNILKGAHLVLQDENFLLPIIENEKTIGVVRMGDVFHEITNALLEL